MLYRWYSLCCHITTIFAFGIINGLLVVHVGHIP
jgi:hypothetical protein